MEMAEVAALAELAELAVRAVRAESAARRPGMLLETLPSGEDWHQEQMPSESQPSTPACP